MRALVVDPAIPGRLALQQVPDPSPRPDQCLIQVEACSLNRGEVNRVAHSAKGTVLGWDAAGTVLQPAANGNGPVSGTRVVTWAADGAWAERRAVTVENVAPLPDTVDVGVASALPVAGVTALRALRLCGPVLGRRVLVSGAAGGVGRFAVQLAHRAGAHVVAVVGSEARAAGLTELGADEIVTNVDAVTTPVFGVIENVGGPTLATAFRLLTPGGTVVSIGAASGQPTTLPAGSTIGPRRTLMTFQMHAEGGPLGSDLAYLVGLVEAGGLDAQIGWRGNWERTAEAAQLLLDRKVNGKAVLDVR